MVIKQRAISNEEKLERRDAILVAALELLTEDDYHDISIERIARQAGVAKGTIFLYFQTKEELFLQLQMKEYKAWFEDINNRIRILLQQKRSSIDEFVKIVVASAGQQPLLMRLTPILHIILEHNVDYKTALEFKRFLLNEMQTTGQLIEQYFPFLPTNGGTQFLLDLQVLLIGLIQLSHPAPVVKKVIEKKGMEALQLNFEEKLREILTHLLYGIKAADKE